MRALITFLLFSFNLATFSQHVEIDLLKTKAESKYIDYQAKKFLKESHVDGFTFIIGNQGRIVYSKAFGFADKVKNIPLTLNHRFPMLNATKLLTATATLKLVEKNIITLEDRIVGPKSILEKEIPKAPEPISQMTIKHLLEESAYITGDIDNQDRINVLAEAAIDSDTKNIPGESPGYNGYNYYILGTVLEYKTKKKYRNIIEDLTKDIFKNRVSFQGDLNLKNIVVPPKVKKQFDEHDFSDAYSGLICSPADMMNFMLSLDGYGAVKDILTPIGIRILKSPHRTNQKYGKAWEIDDKGYYITNKSYYKKTTLTMRNNFDGLTWIIVINGRRSPKDFLEKVFRRVRKFP
ncbi:MAG: beta-lactamase family protein [Lentisphaeraceae bacterium]|nr:beta-lactamase family protein [Lentisphaeraceae bacterium]